MIVYLLNEGCYGEVVDNDKKIICGRCQYKVYRIDADTGKRQGDPFMVTGHFLRPVKKEFNGDKRD